MQLEFIASAGHVLGAIDTSQESDLVTTLYVANHVYINMALVHSEVSVSVFLKPLILRVCILARSYCRCRSVCR